MHQPRILVFFDRLSSDFMRLLFLLLFLAGSLSLAATTPLDQPTDLLVKNDTASTVPYEFPENNTRLFATATAAQRELVGMRDLESEDMQNSHVNKEDAAVDSENSDEVTGTAATTVAQTESSTQTMEATSPTTNVVSDVTELATSNSTVNVTVEPTVATSATSPSSPTATATSTAETTTTVSTPTTTSQPDRNESSSTVATALIDNGGGMPTGIVALVTIITLVIIALAGYVGLIAWRRYLECRYGNRELLVNDLEFDTNDLRHFEL